MKQAFTLIEMIFVVILIGLLAVGAINSIPDNTLLNNTKFIYNKILEKKANALSFMVNMNNKEENETVCIEFNKAWIEDDENNSKVKFDLSNRISIASSDPVVCFDYMGRPYKGDVNLTNFNNILYDNVDIKVSYKNSDKNITIYPLTGYVEIK